jgi:hypothetical protein
VVLDADSGITLSDIVVRLDGREAGAHAYTEIESEALRRGGAHRIALDGVRPGAHDLTAEIRGTDAAGKPFQREGVVRIPATAAPSFVQLRVVSDRTAELRMTLME